MSSHIEVSDETKALLESVKREDETVDDLLARLVRETHSLDAGVWEGTEKSERARAAIDRLRSDFDS